MGWLTSLVPLTVPRPNSKPMNPNNLLKLTESPRDAQQGLPYIIPAEKRAEYINSLMHIGFDVIDFGSFVSPRAIPQMADQEKVLEMVDKTGSNTKLMAIVGNIRGGMAAATQPKVDILGFPYSNSETFLLKNINSDNSKALATIDGLLEICRDNGKELRIFMSMAFGNPYGDEWNIRTLSESLNMLIAKGIRTITLADTIGSASADVISEVFTTLLPNFPGVEIGLHIHTRPDEWYVKIDAAWKAECRSFDGVINGIGGCPMTGYEMVGNLNTLSLLDFLEEKGVSHGLESSSLARVRSVAYQ